MKKFILLFVISFVAYSTFGQEQHHYKNEKHVYHPLNIQHHINSYPDSLRMEFVDNQSVVVLECKNYEVLTADLKSMHTTIQELVPHIERMVSKKSSNGYRVNVNTDLNEFKKITLTEKSSVETETLLKDNQVLQLIPSGWEIFITDANHKIYIYSPELEQLKKIPQSSYEAVLTKLTQSKTFSSRRKSVKSRFVVENTGVKYHEVKFFQPLDMISLSAGGSFGVLRNNVFPELNGALGLYFADRYNRRNHRIELSYSSMYFAKTNMEGQYIDNISSFVSLSWSKNLISKEDGTAWIGIGAGYLVQQAGDFDMFKGKTMKFFLITPLGKSGFSAVPELYLTNDFKKTIIGMKLSYKF